MRYTTGETIIKKGGQVGQMLNRELKNSAHHFIPPVILSGLIHYAEQNDLDYLSWFSDLNIPMDQLREGEGFLDFQSVCQVIERAIQQYPHHHLGLRIGSNEALISMGILGFTMQSCKTVEDALKLGLHYHPISGSALDLRVNMHENMLELEATERFPNATLLPFFCEEAFASILTFLNSMIGTHDTLHSIEFSYSKPEDCSSYQNIFNCPMHFQSTKNSIRFHMNILEKVLKSYSPANYAIAVQICEKTFNSFKKINQPDYHQKIYHLIEKKLPERLNMEHVAHLFNMSERQLRRILLMEGLNFQLIRQEVLENRAKQLICEEQSITEISQQLGFSELREFRRAFKKWTGETPSDYKKKRLKSSVF